MTITIPLELAHALLWFCNSQYNTPLDNATYATSYECAAALSALLRSAGQATLT